MVPSSSRPAVGRASRYFLLGLALPTFLSLLHLNLKILLLQGAGEWEASGASSAWVRERAGAAAAASLDAIERLQAALAEEQVQVVVESHAQARVLKEAMKQVDARLKVPGLQLYSTIENSELEPGTFSQAWQRRLLETREEGEPETESQSKSQSQSRSRLWPQSQTQSQGSPSQGPNAFLGTGGSKGAGVEESIGDPTSISAELLHWLKGLREPENARCKDCRGREVGGRKGIGVGDAGGRARMGRRLQGASEAQDDPEVAGVSLSADGETAGEEEETSKGNGADGGVEFVIQGGKQSADEAGGGEEKGDGGGGGGGRGEGEDGEEGQELQQKKHGSKVSQEEAERQNKLAVAAAQTRVASLEGEQREAETGTEAGSRAGDQDGDAGAGDAVPAAPKPPSALTLLMRRRKVVSDQLRMPMQLLMGQQTTATLAKVETLQEGVVKLVRRTELKDRITHCHSLLLSLTRLNQAICNGETSPWCRDAPWLHFSPARCTQNNDGRPPSLADKSPGSESEAVGMDTGSELGSEGRENREGSTPSGVPGAFQVRRQWQAKHEALVSRACAELEDFLGHSRCHTQWPVPGTATRTTNARGAVSGQLVDCGLQGICAARAKRRAREGCTRAEGEGESGACKGGFREGESGSEGGSGGGRDVPDRVEIHSAAAEEDGSGVGEGGGARGRADKREGQRESLLAAPSVLWRVQRSGQWGDDGTGGLLEGWDANSGSMRAPPTGEANPLVTSEGQAGTGNQGVARSRIRRKRGATEDSADIRQGSTAEQHQQGSGHTAALDTETETGGEGGSEGAAPLGDGGHKVSVLLQYFKHPGEIPVILGHYYGCSQGALDRGEIRGLRAELLAFIDETSGWKQWRAEWNKTRGGQGQGQSLFFRGVFSHNFHESRGYNRLASSARGSLLFLIQDDDIPPRSCAWMDKGLQLFKARPLLAIAGFRHGLWRWRNTGWQPVPGTPPWRPRGPTEYMPTQEPGTKVRAYFPSVLDVGPLAVRRSVWQSVGGLDEGLSRWGETHSGYADYDLAYRTWIHGREVMHVGGNKDSVMTGASTPGETHKFSASLVFRDINLHLNRKWVQRLVTWIGPRLERELGRKNRDLLAKDAWVRDSDGKWTK